MGEQSSSDHDLLIRIDEKLNLLIADFIRLRDDMLDYKADHSRLHDREQTQVWEAIDELREANAKQQGIFIGAKWLWGAILALPPSAIAAILGVNQL